MRQELVEEVQLSSCHLVKKSIVYSCLLKMMYKTNTFFPTFGQFIEEKRVKKTLCQTCKRLTIAVFERFRRMLDFQIRL